MRNFEFKQVDYNTFELWLCKKLYDKMAILNASYKNSNKAYFKLDIADDMHVAVIIKFKSVITKNEVEDFINDFCNEVIDQQIRLDLDSRTADIKKLIYEKAFSVLKV